VKIIRLGGGDSSYFFAGRKYPKERKSEESLEGDVENDCARDYDRSDHEEQHQRDEPGGTIGGLWGGLGNAEKIDEEVGQGVERAHGDWMITEGEKNLYFLHPGR
jgi:hypothetical protein